MTFRFLVLQWKSLVRSASFGKSIAVKLLLACLGLFLLFSLAGTGRLLVPLLKELVPGTDPFDVICAAAVGWFLAELVIRYMLQELSTLQVRPLLTLPIKRSSIVHFVLLGSVLSFFLLAMVIFLVPLGIALTGQGLSPWHLAGWCVGILLISQLLGQLVILVGQSDRFLLIVVVVAMILAVAQYFHFIDVFGISQGSFRALYDQPLFALIPLVLSALLYQRNFVALRERLYLDEALQSQRTIAVSGSTMAWADLFGSAAPFIRLDLRMIWRNKRPCSQVLLSLIFVFYGIMVHDPSDPKEALMLMFISLFITGFMMITFGQYIPAWDSDYYSMLMVQNNTMLDYLRSKAILLRAGIAIMFLASLPYVLLDRHWALPLAVNMIYNLGVTLPIILFFGSMNKKRVDLGRGTIGNYQGIGVGQFLLVIPVLLPPIAIYLSAKFFFSNNVAMLSVAGIGLLGIVFQKPLMRGLADRYTSKKYAMVAGFKEKG
ncbi:MAG: DUF5687 family protein [Flavobacteriales bacterium]